MMFKINKYALSCLIALLLCSSSRAQFYNDGNEPAILKWSQITTPSYRVIYPRGMDEMAREYALTLERVKVPVGGSLGYVPNQSYRTPMPVILHPYTVKSNGMVSWCPRRMELVTIPEFQNPEAMPWIRQLSIHESRHAAQMQPYAGGGLKFLQAIVGDISPSLLCAILGGPSAMEGDAVLAETSLSASGRGRSADFLEYQRACFLASDTRNYWEWRYGSLKNYCPDYYKIGYIMAAGMREYSGFSEWPFFSLTRKIPKAFPAIADSLTAVWKKEASERAPFMPCDSVTLPERRYVDYSSLTANPKGIIARRKGLLEASQTVRIDPSSGKWAGIRSSSHSSSRLKANPDSTVLYWSEERNNHRWEMISYSVIRSLDLESGRIRNLTAKSRFFNPSVSEDGKFLAASQSLEDGSSAVMILDAYSGKELYSYPAPKGLQVLETTWKDDNVYASVLGPDGIGLYFVSTFEPVLAARPAKIKELGTYGDALTFVSDRNGVDELYSLNPENGKVLQLTSSVQGSNNHCFVSDSLYYTSLGPGGRMILRTAIKDLPVKEIDYQDIHSWVLADSLTAAEPVQADYSSNVQIGDPEPYSRLGHLVNVHSWLPLYANTDIIENISFDNFLTACGLGVSAYFQNELSTLQGFAGYSAWTPDAGWANAGHLRLTYSGFYPVFEVSTDLSDEGAFATELTFDKEKDGMHSTLAIASPAAFSMKVRSYVPLDFSSGGWNRGIVPQLRWTFSNDRITFQDNTACSNSVSASIRAYTIRDMASSGLYPRWGAGVEAGYCTRPGIRNLMVDNLYGYVYGYVPGFLQSHGVKISALAERNIGNALLASPFASVAPRGGYELNRELARYRHHGKLSVDYALPFAPVDWSFLSPLTYIRNFELIAHYDLSYYLSSKSKGSVSSIGADVVAKLGNVLFIPYDTRIGVSFCRLFSSIETDPYYWGIVFSIDI